MRRSTDGSPEVIEILGLDSFLKPPGLAIIERTPRILET
jgi:hypothetical protein